MLAYHPALDAYHTALRILQFLVSRDGEYQLDALRILDFFLVFPEETRSIRVPRHAQSLRAQLRASSNPYWFEGDRLLTFAQMKVIQNTALSLLSAKGLIDPVRLQKGRVKLVADKLPEQLADLLRQKNAESAMLMALLVGVLGELPVRGRDGLKERTKLMEFRYDSV